ncbi:MAG: right-handed parallel beta-helix repeat-containing protein [Bacteroidales bacterium]|nr:right-handed parallel beta-helix repeat-containing protein [Bacteroidales bacterium]
MRRYFFILFCLLAVSCSRAVRLSPGDDIQAALDGDASTIILSPGVYRLDSSLRITRDNMTLKGKGTICGSRQIKFSGTDGDLWVADIPEGLSCHQLFVNSRRATLARTPDFGELFRTGKVEETPVGEDIGIQKLALEPGQEEVLSSSDSLPIITFLHSWDMTRRKVQASDPGTLTVSGQLQKPWKRLDMTSQFYFSGDKSFISTPGEWCRVGRTIYYKPMEGEDISSAVAEVPFLDSLLVIRGTEDRPVRNVRIKDISFGYTCHALPEEGENPQQASAFTSATVMVDNARDVLLESCEIAHTGACGLWLRDNCEDVTVSACALYDLGAGGIKLGPVSGGIPGKNLKVDDCLVCGGGRVIETAVGILLFNASDCIISHNEISDFIYSGISVGWVWGYGDSPSKRNTIEYNHIHHLGWAQLSDMGGIYTLGPSEGTVVRGNVIHDVYSYGYGGWGLYTDEGSTGILFEDNLVYHCKSSAFHQHYGKDNILRNNILADNVQSGVEASRVEDHNSFTFKSNIVVIDHSPLYNARNWARVRADIDSNLYWRRDTSFTFNGLSQADWADSTGKDRSSVVADPDLRDMVPHNKTALKAIGFKLFDPSKAGTRSKRLDALAEELLPAERKDLFDSIVIKYRNSKLHDYE